MSQPVPTFYPTASRVTGVQKDDLKTVQETIEFLKKVPKFVDLFEGRHKVRDQYIKDACAELNFEVDVVKDRSIEALTFDKAKDILLRDIYAAAGIKEKKKRDGQVSLSAEAGRMNSKDPNVKIHVNCHAVAASDKYDTFKQKQKEKAQVRAEELKKDVEPVKKERKPQGISKQTEIMESVKKKKKALTWDEYILTRVSKNTARWVVSNHVPNEERRNELKQFLDDRKIGFQEQEDLIVDQGSELGDIPEEDVKLRRIKTLTPGTVITREGTVLTIGENMEKKMKSVYFKQDLVEEDEEIKKVVDQSNNRTTEIDYEKFDIEAKTSLRQSFKQDVGDKVYETDEKFVQELLVGSKPVFQKKNQNDMMMTSGNTYSLEKTDLVPKEVPGKVGLRKGATQRWKSIPQEKRDDREMVSDRSLELHLEKEPTLVPLNSEGKYRQMIVEKWLKVNKVGSMWHKAQIADIIEALESVNTQSRLEGIAVCAKASVYRLEKYSIENLALAKTGDPDADLDLEDIGHLPEGISELVNMKLNDPSEAVRFGAALTIFMLGTTCESGRVILEAVLDKASTTIEDKMIAALTLTYAGYCNSNIANVFISSLLNTSEEAEYELCMTALAKLSDSTKVIHCLIGELLNSTSWKHRFLACKVFPRLKGQPNKDIIHKLVHVMWNDSQPDVRTNAAMALGRLKLGYYVHSELLKLYKSSDRDKILDAVVRSGQLGIMTSKLLPLYINCFDHDYISVRVACCNTASALMLRHPDVLQKIEACSQFDISTKVKAAAIRAFADIGFTNPEVSAGILWSLRWIQDLEVVTECARAVIRLNMRTSDVTKVVQERLLILKDAKAVKELRKVLEWLGEDPTGDLEMIRSLKEGIRKQSTKQNIFRMIRQLEDLDEHDQIEKQLLYHGTDERSTRATTAAIDTFAEYNTPPKSSGDLSDASKPLDFDKLAHSSPILENKFQSQLQSKANQDASFISRSESSFSTDSEQEIEIIQDTEKEEKGEKEEITPTPQKEVKSPQSNAPTPPKPTFFKSLALSRPSSQKTDN